MSRRRGEASQGSTASADGDRAQTLRGKRFAGRSSVIFAGRSLSIFAGRGLATPSRLTLSCAPRRPAERFPTVPFSSPPHRWACRRCPTACMQSRLGNTFPYLCLCMITHAYIHTHKEQVVALAGRSLTRMKGGAWHSQPSSRPARHGVVRLGAWAFRRDPRIHFKKPCFLLLLILLAPPIHFCKPLAGTTVYPQLLPRPYLRDANLTQPLVSVLDEEAHAFAAPVLDAENILQ